MNPADLARNQAISLEAKKDALAQRQSGDWKISFTVQGADMDARLTKAAMGTRFAMVLVEIGDDELPVQKEAPAQPRQDTGSQSPPDGARRMDWRDMPPAAQAGIRCNEPAFRTFLMEEHSFRPRQDHDSADEAAVFIRGFFRIKSRSELGTDPRRRVLWKQMDDQFQAWKALEHA
jgi:hypothetical protein